MSSSSDLSGIPTEALPLKSTCDIPTEPFAWVGDAAKLDHQLRLAHLVQTGLGQRIPRAPDALPLVATTGCSTISDDADQVVPENQ